jgi:predicted outer membrane protein
MLRRIPRFLRRAVLVAVVLAVSVSVYQSWSSGSPGTGGWTQTQWGPLGPADRDLLVKVRLAGLWEGPTGQQAQQQAVSDAVREVGGKLAVEHADLDRQVREVSNELGVLLPSSPNQAQMGWMADISSRTGADYDRVFIQRVREAHGQILPAIAAVRSGTRNDKVRQFAEVADSFVSRHCQYLESTGLVNYASLPMPPSPGLLSGSTDPHDLILPIVVFVLTILGAIGLFSALRARGSKRPARVTVPQPANGPPLPALAGVAAMPGSRSAAEMHHSSPPMLEAGSNYSGSQSGGGLSDTGSYRAADTGSYPSLDHTSLDHTGPDDPSPDHAISDRPVSDYRSNGSAPREYRSSVSGTYRAVSGETETFRAITESDVFRPVSDSGGYRAVTDSGGYRIVADGDNYSDTGSRRIGSRSRSRHSIRR